MNEYWIEIKISRKLGEEIKKIKRFNETIDGYAERILKAHVRHEEKEIGKLLKEIRGDNKKKKKLKA